MLSPGCQFGCSCLRHGVPCAEQVQLWPVQVDAVIVACSCFTPTPSMASMIVHRFKMRSDIVTYNLSGMGCSSSVVCVGLARDMLKASLPKLSLTMC